jgi:thiamine monophosphate synthase
VRTAPAHDRRELIAAKRAGAHLVLLSPVFATRSHPGQNSLGVIRFGLAAGSLSGRRGLNRVHYWPSPQRKLGSHACGGRSRPPEIPACAGMTGLSGGSDLKLANPGGPHIIALGGMTSRRFDRLRALGAYGWAAIDGLTPHLDRNLPDQNLKVVPR